MMQHSTKTTELFRIQILETYHGWMIFRRFANIFHFELSLWRIGQFKQRILQASKSHPIIIHGSKFRFWNTTKHRSVQIPSLHIIRRVDISRDVEIVTIGTDFFLCHQTRVFWFFFLGNISINYALDVRSTQFVFLAFFLESFGCINYKYITCRA